MIVRWTAAGVLEAERSFRRIVGYRGLPKLQGCELTMLKSIVALTIGKELPN
jgi:hypothetical protein